MVVCVSRVIPRSKAIAQWWSCHSNLLIKLLDRVASTSHAINQRLQQFLKLVYPTSTSWVRTISGACRKHVGPNGKILECNIIFFGNPGSYSSAGIRTVSSHVLIIASAKTN